MILHGFFRSTASWRVRIALALKGLSVEARYYRLREKDQLATAYLALNPQGLVPALELDDGTVLTQSLAICEYLDELCPDPPLLPAIAVERARARGFAQIIACDIHPIQNLKVLQRLAHLGLDAEQVNAWARDTIEPGLSACEKLLAARPAERFAFGATPGIADLCLVPQLANARRFGLEIRWPRILAIEAHCLELLAFRSTAPENQPDFPGG